MVYLISFCPPSSGSNPGPFANHIRNWCFTVLVSSIASANVADLFALLGLTGVMSMIFNAIPIVLIILVVAFAGFLNGRLV